MVDGSFRVVWTPDFTKDVYAAVHYVSHVLKAPQAAKNLLDGVEESLERQTAMPEAAVKRRSAAGEVFYEISWKNYNIFYTIEGSYIKAVGLKHRLQQ